MRLRTKEGETYKNAVFVKRRASIKKKVMELENLCDVKTLLVCFGPHEQLETLPEDLDQVRLIMEEYSRLNAHERINCNYDLSPFFETHLKKLHANLAQTRGSWINTAAASQPASLQDFLSSIDARLAEIDKKIDIAEVEKREDEMEAYWEQQLSPLEVAMPLTELPPAHALEGDILHADRERSIFGGMKNFSTKAQLRGSEDDLFMGGGWENGDHDETMPPSSSSIGAVGDLSEFVPAAIATSSHIRHQLYHPVSASSSHIQFLQ